MTRYKGHFEAGADRRRTAAEQTAAEELAAGTAAPDAAGQEAPELPAPEQAPAAQESANAKQKKKSRAAWIVLCVLLLLAVTMGSFALTVALRGRSMRRGTQTSAPQLPSVVRPQQETEEEEQEEPLEVEQLPESGDIIYKGQHYRFNDDIVTFLLLGIDSRRPEDTNGVYNVEAFSDVIMLAALDYHNRRISFMTLSRDAMCQFPLLDPDGNVYGQTTAQLALAFSYGDGGQKSLELTKNAVSALLGNLPIYSCSALYLDGLGALNDAVGGVTLEPLETIRADDVYLEQGRTVTLNAREAELYIRSRQYTVEGNLIRMEREKQYFKALVRQMLVSVRKDTGTAMRVYNAVKGDVVTDLDLSDILYLSATAAKMKVTGDVMGIPGSVRLNEDSFAEFYIDEQGFLELLLSVYYEPVED